MCASSNVETLSMQSNVIESMNSSILDDLDKRHESITNMNW